MVLWFCGSMVLRPRSAPVLASACPGASLGHDFMAFSGFSSLFCPPTLPLGEFRPETSCVRKASLVPSTMKVWTMSVYVDTDTRIGSNELSCCRRLLAAAAAKIFSRPCDLKRL